MTFSPGDIESAYAAGRRAFRMGKGESASPYLTDTKHHEAFLRGLSDAAEFWGVPMPACMPSMDDDRRWWMTRVDLNEVTA